MRNRQIAVICRPARARVPAHLFQRREIPRGPAERTRIFYGDVDQYDEDTLTTRRTLRSKRPPSAGERTNFLLGAWSLQAVLEMSELDRVATQHLTRTP
jgi:hypothetical protein